MKNLLKMSDLSPAELTHILDVADQLKAQQKLGGTAPLLAGKTVALMFSKASTRTRTSFEVGVYQLGGLGNYMNTAELQAGRGEPLKDTARVLGRYYDCVVWRTYRQSDLEEFAEQDLSSLSTGEFRDITFQTDICQTECARHFLDFCIDNIKIMGV